MSAFVLASLSYLKNIVCKLSVLAIFKRKFPAIPLPERPDFQHAHDTLVTRADLLQSCQRQQRARLIMRVWRTVHITLACIALLVISYHGVMELLTNVFHVIAAQ